MRRSRFSVQQIVAVLKQVEPGLAVADACRKMGISSATFYVYGLPVECNGLTARPMS